MLNAAKLIATALPALSSDNSPQVKQTFERYENKALLHYMTWSCLFKAGAPYAVYSVLEKDAYEDYFNEEKTDESPETREHFTYEVEKWEEIA